MHPLKTYLAGAKRMKTTEEQNKAQDQHPGEPAAESCGCCAENGAKSGNGCRKTGKPIHDPGTGAGPERVGDN
jgi:hypothetical protein